jgi:hypothetical protein
MQCDGFGIKRRGEGKATGQRLFNRNHRGAS